MNDHLVSMFAKLAIFCKAIESRKIQAKFSVRTVMHGEDPFTVDIETGTEMWDQEPVEKVLRNAARELVLNGHGRDYVQCGVNIRGEGYLVALFQAAGEQGEQHIGATICESVPYIDGTFSNPSFVCSGTRTFDVFAKDF